MSEEGQDLTSKPPGPVSAASVPAVVPDHELVRLIGKGSYGEVWLARNTLGTYRAVKIVFASTFRHRRPFEREYNGVQKFEPVSRLHDGLMDVLQVGRNDSAEYFYCVMELADDVRTGQNIDPDHYVPRTLAHDVARLKRLPIGECLILGAAVASALEFLHGRGLTHRDVKPSNIVFVNGVPKLADIGLVVELSEARSYVGTEGFIPPEGPGTVQADIYSLGKVLYEISTGKDRHDYPDLPTRVNDLAREDELFRLHEVVVKACRADPRQRYPSAGAMTADLQALQRGEPTRARPFRRWLPGALSRDGIVVIGALIAGGFFLLGGHAAAPRAPVVNGPGKSGGAGTPRTDPPGLIGWWRGENSATDAAGGNHGTVAGTGTVNYGPGKIGQAFVFDGIHRDRIDLGNPASLRLEDFTVEAWIKRFSATNISFDDQHDDGTTVGEGGVIFGYGTGGYTFALTDNGRLITGRQAIDGVCSTNAVADTNWHHVAVTKSGANVVFYIDDTMEVVPNYDHPFDYTFRTSAAIGSCGDGSGGSFFGMIDELSIYDHALSAAEIRSIGFDLSPRQGLQTGRFAPPGLVGRWEAEGKPDDVVGGSHGKERGPVKYSPGVRGRAFRFDEDSCVEVPDHPSLNPTNAITVACWLNRRAPMGRFDQFVWKAGPGSQAEFGGYSLGFVENTVAFWIHNGTWLSSSEAALEFGKWYHVAGLYDGTNLLCYVNGCAVGNPVKASGAIVPSSHSLHIGGDPNDPERLYNGLVDEVSIYNRALSAAEIQALYQEDSGESPRAGHSASQ